MDKVVTTSEAAAELHVSVPRILRATRKGVVASVRRGNRTLLTQRAVQELRGLWGWTPRHDELTREELSVLAALSRRPRGVRSARRIARHAAISPTTVSAALRRLADRGFVERSTVTEVAGAVRDVQVWLIRWDAWPWQRVAGDVGRVTLPTGTDARARDARVPSRLAHLFWNTDVRDLTVDDHAVLIASRILRSADPEALAWMTRNLPPDAIADATRGRGLDRRSAALGRVLAGAA